MVTLMLWEEFQDMQDSFLQFVIQHALLINWCIVLLMILTSIGRLLIFSPGSRTCFWIQILLPHQSRDFYCFQKFVFELFSTQLILWYNVTYLFPYFHFLFECRVYNLTQSSRALGWDTNNYLMDSYRGCGNLSSNAFYHTGYFSSQSEPFHCLSIIFNSLNEFKNLFWLMFRYTGTEVCCDPNRKIFTILLTNRSRFRIVLCLITNCDWTWSLFKFWLYCGCTNINNYRCYPDSTSTLPAIQIVRQQFNNAVKSVLDSHSIEILEQKIIPFEI
jgi:hypothetical protein